MFSIEHEFDSTIITLVDERTDKINKITFSMGQIKDLSAAINLPEGVYSRFHKKHFKQ